MSGRRDARGKRTFDTEGADSIMIKAEKTYLHSELTDKIIAAAYEVHNQQC